MTTNTPPIAVLMPVYNPGPELVQTLDSLRQQTVPFKLYLIDDGSAKRPDYEKLLVGLNHKLIISPKNLGVNQARNPALLQILEDRISLIALIDCGDLAMPQRLELQSRHLQENTKIAVLGSAIELRTHGDNGELVSTRILTFPKDDAGCRTRIWKNMPVSHPALMFRREVFLSVGVFSATYPAAEDYDMIWRASRAGFNIANLPEVLLIKQETAASVSRQRRQRQILSRLRLQWDNKDPTKLLSYTGLARSLITLSAPQAIADKAKTLMGR